MARNLGTLIGIVLVSGSIGCLLYTDPVNVAPTITSIVVSPMPPVRGGLTFTADVHDDDQDKNVPLVYDWGLVSGACPDGGGLPIGDRIGGPGTDAVFTRPVTAFGDYCVFLTVTDEHQATHFKTATFHVQDRPPVALISQILDPVPWARTGTMVPLYSDLHFSAGLSSDPDGDKPWVASWKLLTPMGGAASGPMTPPPCDGAPDDVCLTVLVPGTYKLDVTVKDDQGMTAPGTLSVIVAKDQPPCIVSPDLEEVLAQGRPQDPAKDKTFTVKVVDDDGDPFPAMGRPSMLSFVWSVRVDRAGSFVPKVSLDIPDFLIPGGTYRSGQVVEVRVEVDDRRPDQIETRTCYQASPDEAVCPWPLSSCNQWVTWTVEFQ